MTTLNERFKAKIAKTETCWLWTGYKTRQGYGRLYDRPKEIMSGLAHRISWRLHFGEIPDGLHVLHKCDNPSCVNPEHLFLGTNLDNVRDKLSKNRQPYPPRSTITPCLVKNMRALYAAGVHCGELDRRFKVRSQRIVNGTRWSTIPLPYVSNLPREVRFFRH